MSQGGASPTPASHARISVVVALSDELLGGAIRMRLEVEPDIAVVAIVHQLADAIDAARNRRADVVIVESALLGGGPGYAPHELRDAIGRARLILLSPHGNEHTRWASELGAAEVLSPLDGPDRLLEVIRSGTDRAKG